MPGGYDLRSLQVRVLLQQGAAARPNPLQSVAHLVHSQSLTGHLLLEASLDLRLFTGLRGYRVHHIRNWAALHCRSLQAGTFLVSLLWPLLPSLPRASLTLHFLSSFLPR
jgi:hypothetical protein